MRRFSILFAALMLLSMSSCKKALENALKQDASGTPYDLYIVMDDALKGVVIDDTLRTTPLYDSLHAVFEYPMAFMPNSDAFFRVRHINPENFSSPVIRTVANVAIIDIAPDNASEPIITLERDRFANDQVIVRMHAKSAESLAERLSEVQEQLRDVYVKNELNRRIKILQEDHQARQQDRLMKMQEVSMLIPLTIASTCNAAADSAHFFWATDGFEEKTSFLVCYSVPYTDQNIFSLEGAIAVRDSVMGANITAGSDSMPQRMETRREIVVPQYRALNVGGRYVGELTGMWRMPGQLMAGPFICHMRLDEVRKRVVIVEGFCYAPKVEDKRQMIRNLEATLYTLKLPSDNLIPEIEVTL